MGTLLSDGNVTYDGCDFVVQVHHPKPIRLLQITDMQIIDASQRRTPQRLRPDEVRAWAPENFDMQCANHIRSVVAQTNPDLIFITGDIVYGSFDDNGSVLKWICSFMDSLGIPWAPVFGNHDNESAMGVEWQCRQFESSEYCLFRRGTVSGNSNYTIGIANDIGLIRILHMVDSNGCRASSDPDVIKQAGIYPDQIEEIKKRTERVRRAAGRVVPAIMAFHIPVADFARAEVAKGYASDNGNFYTLGVDAPGADGDFGCKNETIRPIQTDASFIDFLKECNIEAVFAGHHHAINTSISYEGIRWTFGLKTGQYDYHNPGQTGGTLICLIDDGFRVSHVPSLALCAPYPNETWMFQNFFA